MSVHYMGRILLLAGITMIWNIFFLTGCGQEGSSNVEVRYESETAAEDDSKHQSEITLNMPSIESYPDGTVCVEIQGRAQYAAWISQLENYTGCIGLNMDLQASDVTVYLDEILAYDNFKYVTIENGGKISARDCSAVNVGMMEKIVFDQVCSIDEELISCIPKQVAMRIRINDQYEGEAPVTQLLLDTDHQDIALQWCGGKTLLSSNAQQVLSDHLPEWDQLGAALSGEQRMLGGFWRLTSGNCSYTEYEFYDWDTGKIVEAFICIKGQESNGKDYFDVIYVPEESLQELSCIERERMRLEDINFDGCQDMIVVGAYSARLGEFQCEAFLWNESDKTYQLVTEGRRSNSQISVRKNADGYEVKLYDQSYSEVFSMQYTKEPWIVEVTEDVWEIGFSAGSPVSNVFYFDKDSGKISMGYMNSRLIDKKYIAYMENGELIFTDIFNEEIHMKIKRDFAPAVDPVISIEMLDNATIYLQYYKGENFTEEQEEIPIRKG